MQVRLLTLGTVRCFLGDDEIAELPGQPLRCAVLLHLAVEREVTRESLVSLLWPERAPDRARHALNQKLYQLRRVLGDEWLDSQAERLCTTPSLRVDAREFEDAAERGALEQALSHYRGSFLTDFYVRGCVGFDHWADRHRSRLARLHRRARDDFIDRCVAEGRLERAILEARRWVELEPSEDEAHHRLIGLLSDTGDRAGAIRQYERYERELELQELEPLDQTRALIERVRGSTAAPSPGPPPAGEGAGEGGREPPPEPPAPAGPGVSPPALPRRRGIGIASLAAILVLAATGWWASRDRPGGSAPPPRSIAVLPFLNLSTEPGNEHLSDGIAEELIHALSQVDSLRVAARTSSFRFRGADLGIRTIGDSLNVGLVVEGSVRQERDRLRITAQLIDVSDGYHVWSRTFDREAEEMLAVQQEIADAIVDALRISLAPPERARLALGGTTDPEAHELLLLGRHRLQQGTRTAVRDAIRHLDSAVVRDPDYALAHAALARAYVLAATRGDLPRREAVETARSMAERAIFLAPNLSEAHAALGRAELELWNWDSAEREARLAIELRPGNAAAHATYAGVLMVRGRLDEAVREGALAAEIEPFSAAAADVHAETLRAAGRLEEAVRAHRRALELEPDLGRQSLAKTYLDMGRYESALEEFRAAAERGAPRFPTAQFLWAAYTRAREGREERARELLRTFEDRRRSEVPRSGTAHAYLLAATHMALGDRDRAFDLLEEGVRRSRQPAWRQLPWDPVWEPVREDPRFVRLLETMGL